MDVLMRNEVCLVIQIFDPIKYFETEAPQDCKAVPMFSGTNHFERSEGKTHNFQTHPHTGTHQLC